MSNITKKSLITKLKLTVIEEGGDQLYEVLDNLEILLNYFFPEEKERIKKEVEILVVKYSHKIDGDYDEFMRIANKTNAFKKWSNFSTKITEGLPTVAHAVVDLYFQMYMINHVDVCTCLLINAYTEDIQPFLD